MAELKVGTRVSFSRAHDRQHELTGVLTEVRDDEVLVSVDPDSMPVWATAADITVVSADEEDGAELGRSQDDDAELIEFVTSRGYSEDGARRMLTGPDRALIIADLERSKAIPAVPPQLAAVAPSQPIEKVSEVTNGEEGKQEKKIEPSEAAQNSAPQS